MLKPVLYNTAQHAFRHALGWLGVISGMSEVWGRRLVDNMYEIDHCTAFGLRSACGITPSSMLVCGDRQYGDSFLEASIEAVGRTGMFVVLWPVRQ